MDIEKLKVLALEASAGPWQWELNRQNKSVWLTGGRPTFDKIVMDFARWGMGGAAPRFNDAVASGKYNIMERVDKYGVKVPGREHHANWFMGVAHPDAQWIAAANPAAVLELIAEVERLRADAARYRFLRIADLDAIAAGHWQTGRVVDGVKFDDAIDEAIEKEKA
jgi:hypothetical protein